MIGTLLAVLVAHQPTLVAPDGVSVICRGVGYELLIAVKTGEINSDEAEYVFDRCQKNWPPLFP